MYFSDHELLVIKVSTIVLKDWDLCSCPKTVFETYIFIKDKRTLKESSFEGYFCIGPSDPCVFPFNLFAPLVCCQRKSFPLKHRQTLKHKNSMPAEKKHKFYW